MKKKIVTPCLPKIAVIYARYSSHNQTEQSIEGQLHDAYAFAEKNGYTVIKEYIDRALSGTSDSRPAFQQMIKESASRQFQVVIVWKQDRFARNRYDSAVYKRILSKNNVRVVSVMENITDSPEGVILEGLLEAMAEYYSANLSENIRRGKAETVRKGLFPGGSAPYGYMRQDRRIVPDPRTAPIVQEIFRRYADGDRPKDIIADLNDRGIRTFSGKVFQHGTIRSILENRIYIGEFYFNNQLVSDTMPAIVDPAVFDRVASRRAFNRKNPAAFRGDSVPSLLLGKVFCGDCGSKVFGGRFTGRSSTYHYYLCTGKNNHLTDCKAKCIKKDDLHYAVCKVVSDFILNKKRRTLESLAESIMEIYRSDIDTSELKALEKQSAKLENDLNKLVESLIEMPESARPRIARKMEDLELQLNELKPRIARKKAETSLCFSKDDFVKFLQITFDDLRNIETQKFIIDKFINSVYVYQDGRIVVYLNHITGLPFGPDDSKPGKDDWKSGRSLPLPPECSPSGFSAGAFLVNFTQNYR